LFMTGGVFVGNAIAACGLFPRWSGWIYAISTVGFVLSTFLLDIGQSISAVLLFIATVAVAWIAGHKDHYQGNKAGISAEP